MTEERADELIDRYEGAKRAGSIDRVVNAINGMVRDGHLPSRYFCERVGSNIIIESENGTFCPAIMLFLSYLKLPFAVGRNRVGDIVVQIMLDHLEG